MEAQTFENPEDPRQTLPVCTQFGSFFFLTLQNSGKKNDFSRRSWPTSIGLRNFQADLGLDAAQFRVPHALRSTQSPTAS